MSNANEPPKKALPCIIFQSAMASRLCALNHEIIEDYPISSDHADIIDHTLHEWLEIDKVTQSLDDLSTFSGRILLANNKFARNVTSLRGFRRIFILDIPASSCLSQHDLETALEADCSAPLPHLSIDEIRIFKNSEIFFNFPVYYQ